MNAKLWPIAKKILQGIIELEEVTFDPEMVMDELKMGAWSKPKGVKDAVEAIRSHYADNQED